ncbi:MAG: hypothetical protein ACKOFH_11115, partial [Chthoniobacterales bacterium]
MTTHRYPCQQRNGFFKKRFVPRLLAICAMFALVLSSGAFAQTAPTPQSLPYSQNFGTTTFTNAPAGVAVWNGLNGGSISSQALAESSTPTGNATLTAATAAQTTGNAYG